MLELIGSTYIVVGNSGARSKYKTGGPFGNEQRKMEPVGDGRVVARSLLGSRGLSGEVGN